MFRREKLKIFSCVKLNGDAGQSPSRWTVSNSVVLVIWPGTDQCKFTDNLEGPI